MNQLVQMCVLWAIFTTKTIQLEANRTIVWFVSISRCILSKMLFISTSKCTQCQNNVDMCNTATASLCSFALYCIVSGTICRVDVPLLGVVRHRWFFHSFIHFLRIIDSVTDYLHMSVDWYIYPIYRLPYPPGINMENSSINANHRNAKQC